MELDSIIIDTNFYFIESKALKRRVDLTILTPQGILAPNKLPLLLVNDGQDFEALQIENTVQDLIQQRLIPPIMVVGVHANHNRLSEYGVICQSDYANRGDRAANTASFITSELLPFLSRNYVIDTNTINYCGFSLGGLMALDIAWNFAPTFSKVGVFSGSLWWRQKALDMGYVSDDRIMHKQIRVSTEKPSLQFWFECGTNDETDDRDQDGIIDSIQDTLDCISELEKKGYQWGRDIAYTEVKGGEHNPETWGNVMPEFLKWAFGEIPTSGLRNA